MSLVDLAWAVEDVRRRIPGYALAVAYDEGRHRLTFATEKYRNTFGQLFQEFADNLCDDILDSITDRLQINGWSATDDAVGKAAQVLWDDNRGQSRAGAVHRNGFREGDGFVMVQVDESQRVRLHRQHPHQIAVRYSDDNPDAIDVAAKVWRQGKRYRANLYYPDRVERYATKGTGQDGALPKANAFTALQPNDPDLVNAGLEYYVDDDDVNGVPVFHYPNGEVSTYGRSMIVKAIPLQDALNKSVSDMLVAMEYHAYPQRWATGVETRMDPITNQEVSPFAAGEGRIWRVGNKDARMGQFDPASMDGFLAVQDSLRLEIARKGSMPPHQVNLRSGSGAAPSGVSLLVMEGRAVKLARDRQRDWGYQHAEAVAYGLNLAGMTGVRGSDLTCEWAPPETRDESLFWEIAALKMEAGVPLSQILLEAGYDAEDVSKFMADREAASEAEELARDALRGGRRTPVSVGAAGQLPDAPDAPAA